jgi:hypothetical protein
MSKPRVALIFSGQPRCVDGISYRSFKTCILDRYDVDVYAHFWGDIDPNKTTGSMDSLIKLFEQLYKPKSIKVDTPLIVDEYPLELIQKHSTVEVTRENLMTLPYDKGWAAWVRNCVSMYTSMQRAYAVFLDNASSKYDWVIRARTDCVLLRCPRLDMLDTHYMYAPNWHGNYNPVVVNHTLILPPDIAPIMFNIRANVETLSGNMDEQFVYNHLKRAGILNRVRTLPMNIFYPTLTRDGVVTDKPEPTLISEVANPPYRLTPAPQP